MNQETMDEETKKIRDDVLQECRKLKGNHEIPADPWKHRLQGMRCKTCMWFVGKEIKKVFTGIDSASTNNNWIEKPISIGRCRRHAPTMNGYPVVFVNDWCGDHKIDENKL